MSGTRHIWGITVHFLKKKYSLFIWNSTFTWIPESCLAIMAWRVRKTNTTWASNPMWASTRMMPWMLGRKIQSRGAAHLLRGYHLEESLHTPSSCWQKSFSELPGPQPTPEQNHFLDEWLATPLPIAQLQGHLTTHKNTGMDSTGHHTGHMQPGHIDAECYARGVSDISQRRCPSFSWKAFFRKGTSKEVTQKAS